MITWIKCPKVTSYSFMRENTSPNTYRVQMNPYLKNMRHLQPTALTNVYFVVHKVSNIMYLNAPVKHAV